VVLKQVRRPLVTFTAKEPVKVVESHPARPWVERSGHRGLKARRVVAIAEPRRGVAVVFENLADRRVLRPDDAVAAEISRRKLADDTEADRVVVAPGDQRRACRRTERSRVELGVAKPCLGHAVHGRCQDGAAKGSRHAPALVVGHDLQHAGPPLGGTTRAGQYGLELLASRLITSPKGGAGEGKYLPSIVVAPGEPGAPVVWICALADGSAHSSAARTPSTV